MLELTKIYIRISNIHFVSEFDHINFSSVASEGRPQPDNRENGKEFCLAVLNNFYNDGIRWHDVACHHEKAIICERRYG